MGLCMKERKLTFSLSRNSLLWSILLSPCNYRNECIALSIVPELFLFLITGRYLNSSPPSTVCAGPDNSSLVTVDRHML